MVYGVQGKMPAQVAQARSMAQKSRPSKMSRAMILQGVRGPERDVNTQDSEFKTSKRKGRNNVKKTIAVSCGSKNNP